MPITSEREFFEGRVFWPRTSEIVEDFAEIIQQDPESPLSEEQKQEVLSFEKELFKGSYENVPEGGPNLRDIPSVAEVSHRIAPSYLLTAEGRQLMAEQFDVTEAKLDVTSTSEVSNWLRSLPFAEIFDKKDALNELEGQSMKFLKTNLAAAAMEGAEESDTETVTLYRNPEKVFGKMSQLAAYKSFLRRVRADVREGVDEKGVDPLVAGAKLMVTDIYRDKINSRLSETYTSLLSLLPQIDAQSEEVQEQLQPSIEEIAPSAKVARMAAQDPERLNQFLCLLDYVRNGAAVDENGRLSPVDETVFEAVAKVNAANLEQPEDEPPQFSETEIEALGEVVFDAEQMRLFLEQYFFELGIDEEGWSSEKNTKAQSFSVNASGKKVKIPSTYQRAVTSLHPVGPIGIIEHEVGGRMPGHIMQSITASRNTEALAIGTDKKYRGKRYIGLREAGGVAAEADAMKRFFGQTRPSSAAYAIAMKELAGGGSLPSAVRGFARSQLEGVVEPTAQEIEADYALAADRVMRLTRYGGRNSQPVQYVEAAVVRTALAPLDQQARDTLLGEAIYDPVDLIRLHRFGLFSTDTEHHFKPKRDPQQVMVDMLRGLIAKTND